MRANDFLDQPSASDFLDGPGGAKPTRPAAPSTTWRDDLGDITAALLKIGPTAVKGVADLARLATADTVGRDTSKRMAQGMEAINETFGSDAMAAQKKAVDRALTDPNVSLGQLPSVIVANPRAAGDAAVSTMGSMLLPMGATNVVLRAMPLLQRVLPAASRIAPQTAATTTAVVTGAAQNAAETYADTEKLEQADRYKGAAISGAASLVLGKLLGGGAEGVISRRMAGETLGRGAVQAGKSIAKTSAKEFLQETGEESANYVGKQVAADKPIDPNTMAKQGVYGGVIGLGVGGASDAASQVGQLLDSPEAQLARAINADSQALADSPVPTTVQQTVARLMGQPLGTQAADQPAAPEPTPAPIPALGFDPAVQNPQRPMVADAAGNVRELTADELLAQEQDNARRQELGFTQDVERAALQRQAGQPQPDAPAPSDLLQRLLDAGWTPPAQPTPEPQASAPAPAQDEAPQAKALWAQLLDEYGTEFPHAEQARDSFKLTDADIRTIIDRSPNLDEAKANLAALGTTTMAPSFIGYKDQKANRARALALLQTKQDEQPTPADADARYGRDGIDLAEGGKPFKTRAAASKARKLQPMMRVVSHPAGGYVLAMKTPAQLAAQDKAAKRLRQASVGKKGQPMAAHEFIASEGGLHQDVRSDLGIEGNPRIGNRTLYAGAGKGLTLEQATEKLLEAGYISDDSHNTTLDLIRRSLTQAPQYTAEGFERQAEAELEAQYEDHLRAQQEAAQADDFDPFTDLAELGFTEEDGDAGGYWQASPDIQAEVRALAARLDDMGGDSEGLFEDLARQYPDLSQQEFYETARQAITDAIAQLEAAQQGGRGNPGQDDGSQARQDSEQDPDQGLSPDQVALTAARIRRREDPRSFDSRVDEVRQQEVYLRGIARDNPQQAAEIARELRANPAKFSDISGASPDTIGRYARIIEDQLKLAQPEQQQAPAGDGITIIPGKGLIKGKFLVEVDGEGVPGGPFDTELQAREAALQRRQVMAERAKGQERDTQRKQAIADKLRNGQDITQVELDFLGLKPTSDLRWFIPAAADLFGITSRQVRPLIKSLIRPSFSDMGAQYEVVQSLPALRAIGAAQGGELTSYTPADIEQRLDKLEQAEKDRQAADREAERRTRADAERDTFTLTGSDRPADQAAARGQQSLLDATNDSEQAATDTFNKKVADTMGRVRRFASGLSALGDLSKASRASGGLELTGVGVDVGELSKNAIDTMANAIVNLKTAVFVDSGAFGAFRRGLKSGEFKPMNFDLILAKYDTITEAIGKQAEEAGEVTDYPRPLLVMPDMVGDQAGSLELVKKFATWIKGELRGNLSQPIIPIQKGERTMAQSYQDVVDILGTDDFIVGIPSNEKAVTPDELEAFLREARPKAIHVLGAASDTKLRPRIESVVRSGQELRVTADASPVRNQVIRAVAKGAKRGDVIEKLLLNKDDPALARDREQEAAAADQAQAKQPLPIEEDDFANEMDRAVRKGWYREPKEIVRAESRANQEGTISLAQAKKRIEQWKAAARAQGDSGANAGKVVLSLFDASGHWSQPWRDAGYEVHQFDLQHGDDINNFSAEYLLEKLDLSNVHAVLAAPPCTDFSSSGAHAWAKKDADGRTKASIELVRQTLRTIELLKPTVWALENPVGRLASLVSLPNPTLTFQPHNFGDPYTKRTLLWGDFKTDLPLANVEPTQGSKMTKLSGTDKYGRSLTPEGFAYAFFAANNLQDMGAATSLAQEFKGIPDADIQAALDAGLSEAEVRSAIEDDFYDGDIEAARQALREAASQAEPAPAGSRAASTLGRIEDFGEKLQGARKDQPASLARELTDDDIATQPFSKIWPAAEVDAIEDKFAAAVAYAARAEVPAKPRVSYKLKRWVEKVKTVRELAQQITSGTVTPQEFLAGARQRSVLEGFADKVSLLNDIDRSQWGRIGSVQSFPGAFRYVDGKEVPSPYTRVEIDGKSHLFNVGSVGDTLERVNELLGGQAQERKLQFEIRSPRTGGAFSINKKGDKEYRKLKTFDTVKAARDFIDNHYDELAAAWEAVKDADNVKKSDVRGETNRERVGSDRRGGQDVTPEEFGTAFGFRGVEFGNWVAQGGSAKDRQGMLNQAYDALMDLADIVGVPPKAISLNGSLGLAFGSRGSGSASAHFEPGNLVINLTKTRGAGTLAHEWFHALDNYFSRQRGGESKMKAGLNAQQAYREGNYITYRPERMYVHKSLSGTPITKARLDSLRAQHPGSAYYAADAWVPDPNHREGVRPQVEAAFAELVQALDASPMKARAEANDKGTDGYWGRIIERAARAFENYVIFKMMEKGSTNDYLANVRSVEEFPRSKSRYPYLTPDEVGPVAEAFDNLFGTIETRETDQGVAIYSQSGRSVGLPLSLRASESTIEDELEKRLETLAHRPEVVVLDSAVGTLPGARDEDGIEGATWNGRIYLFRDQLSSRLDVQKTLFHELLHYGLRRFLTREQFIAQMTKLYQRDAYIKQEADDWVKTRKGQQTLAESGEQFAIARGVDEALATLAEPNMGQYLKTDLVSRAKVAVTRWLAQLAEALGFKQYAARVRSYKNEEARQLIQDIFGKLREDAAPARAWDEAGDPPFATAQRNSVQSAANTWTVPEPGAGDAFIRAIQNNKIDLKRVRDAIQAQYGRIPDDLDAYLNEELYHGRVAARVDALHRDQVEPLLAKIAVAGKNAGVTLDDVNLYLHARHAPERNAAMQAINPGMQNNDALSGMTNQDAARVMADFQAAGKRQALAAIARDVDQLLADVRTGLVADGLEDAGLVQAWEQAYKHYVPLQRDTGIVDQRGNGRGMGFSVRGPEAKRAVGSNLQVVDILANIVTQAETAAIRAEKAVVGRTLLKMARAYPNKDFWEVDKVPTKARVNPDTGLVERNAKDPLYQTADNVVMVKDYGGEHFIVFNRRSERAMAMAHAMKNLDIAPMNKVLEVANKATRLMASLLTQRNPIFWLTNFARDVQGALLNLEGTTAEGLQRQVAANLPKAFAGMHSLVRGNGSGQWARYAREFQEVGGATGYMQVFDSSAERMQSLEKEVARMQQGKADPRRLARTMLEFIDDYNDIIENAVRLAVFQTARDAGSSTAQAGSIAKNITVNFNRKGNLTPTVNALYMFFNASVQGTARLLQAVATSRKAQAAVGALVVIGFVMDMVNRAMAGDDEETRRNRYDLIPEFEKNRNWIFMNPARPGEYVKVPLPLGPHIFHNTGRLLSDAINRKDARNASEYGWSLAGLFLDAFSPLGSAQSVGQLIAPSVLDPVVQLAENKSFTGGPVYKSADRGMGKTDPRPAYTRHFENTPDVWIGASKAMNELTGGDKIKPGLIDIEPDIMKHLFYTVTGGPGRALDQAIDTAQAPARGREFSINRVPLASRFYGANDDAQRERAYYDDRKRAADAKQQFDYFIKQGRPELAREVARELGDGDEMAGRRKMTQLNAADKQVRAINGQIRKELEREGDDQAKGEQLKALRERRVKVMSDALSDED